MLRFIGGLLLVAASVFALSGTTEANGEQPVSDADVTREEPLGHWAGAAPLVCLQDETNGFPVAEAAKDFEDLPVRLSVQDDCSAHGNVVRVVTRIVEDDSTYSAWFRGEYRDGTNIFTGGTIWLNLDQAFRHTPESWTAVIRHEIGHAVGLGHGEGETIMHPVNYPEVEHLTEGDRAAVAELYK